MPVWLSKKALMLLHGESLSQFGGKSGLRDEGLLDSALARPQNYYAYSEDSQDIGPARLAASYAYGLARNHPFIDGNKRIAFLSIGLFLGINGYKLTADKIEAIKIIMRLAAGETSEEELTDWIQGNMEKD